MSLSDLWYAHRARAGDHAAFDTLFARHAPRVFNLLRRLGASVSEAEDLAQETFLTAYRSLPSWRRTGSFSTWLCGIAVNTYRNHFRTSRQGADDEPLDETTPGLPESDPFIHCSNAEAQTALTQAIAALPDGCREAFVLVYVEQFAYKDAAVLLEIPVGTVQSRLNRAKRLLHIRLSDQLAADTLPATEPKGVNLHVL